MVFERLYTTDYHRVLSAGTWVIRPLAERAMVRDMSESRTYAKAVLETNAAAASRVLAELPEKTLDTRHFTGLFGGRPPPSEIPRYSRWYESLDVTSHRYFHIYYQGLGERRAAAISLAVQLYRADHKKWPDRLDDLVPEYFAAVPADPFHEDGRPLGYVILKKGLPDGGDRPLVYFDEGTVIDGLVDSEPMYGLQQDPQHRSPRVEIRQYRDLSRWLPATRRFDEEPRQEVERQKKEELEPRQSVTQPSPGSLPEAVKNDPREANAPGNDAKKNNGRDD
jgi:hypothetical protein